MAALLDEEKNFIFLQNSEYIKSVELQGVIYIFLRFMEDVSQAQLLLLEARIDAKSKKKVRILRDSYNFNEFLSALIAPARLVSISKIWLPDGTEEFGLLIDNKSKISIPDQTLVELVKLLKGKTIRIRFLSS